MPTMSFCFSGHNRHAQIETAIDLSTGNPVDVSEMSREELARKLNSGDLAISLKDHLESADEIELTDFE